jgi:hypothetical protein
MVLIAEVTQDINDHVFHIHVHHVISATASAQTQ